MKRHWSRPLLAGTLSLTLLAIPAQAIQTGEGFLRGDAMFICYEALDACPKGSDTTLLEALTARGAIQKRGVPMLDPSTRLKANDETLPQQLDYLKEEFGVNDVTIDFSGYPSFTAFTDQLWDYCQARNYWAPWPEQIYTSAEKPEELYWELAAKMEGFWALNERFEGENTQNYPTLAPTDVKNHAWYQAQADYLAATLPRDLWKQRVELKDASDVLLSGLVRDGAEAVRPVGCPEQRRLAHPPGVLHLHRPQRRGAGGDLYAPGHGPADRPL